MRAIRLEQPDRVPVVPLVISHAAARAGIPFQRYNTDPKVIVDCQVAAWRDYGYDGIHVTTDNWILPQALGVPVQFYDDLPPTCLVRPLAAARDLSLLPSVDEAKTAARMGLLPEAMRHARTTLGDSCFVKTNFDQGPFSPCTALRGIDRLMMDLQDDEQFVFDLLEISIEMAFHLGGACDGPGPRGPVRADRAGRLPAKAEITGQAGILAAVV